MLHLRRTASPSFITKWNFSITSTTTTKAHYSKIPYNPSTNRDTFTYLTKHTKPINTPLTNFRYAGVTQARRNVGFWSDMREKMVGDFFSSEEWKVIKSALRRAPILPKVAMAVTPYYTFLIDLYKGAFVQPSLISVRRKLGETAHSAMMHVKKNEVLRDQSAYDEMKYESAAKDERITVRAMLDRKELKRFAERHRAKSLGISIRELRRREGIEEAKLEVLKAKIRDRNYHDPSEIDFDLFESKAWQYTEVLFTWPSILMDHYLKKIGLKKETNFEILLSEVAPHFVEFHKQSRIVYEFYPLKVWDAHLISSYYEGFLRSNKERIDTYGLEWFRLAREFISHKDMKLIFRERSGPFFKLVKVTKPYFDKYFKEEKLTIVPIPEEMRELKVVDPRDEEAFYYFWLMFDVENKVNPFIFSHEYLPVFEMNFIKKTDNKYYSIVDDRLSPDNILKIIEDTERDVTLTPLEEAQLDTDMHIPTPLYLPGETDPVDFTVELSKNHAQYDLWQFRGIPKEAVESRINTLLSMKFASRKFWKRQPPGKIGMLYKIKRRLKKYYKYPGHIYNRYLFKKKLERRSKMVAYPSKHFDDVELNQLKRFTFQPKANEYDPFENLPQYYESAVEDLEKHGGLYGFMDFVEHNFQTPQEYLTAINGAEEAEAIMDANEELKAYRQANYFGERLIDWRKKKSFILQELCPPRIDEKMWEKAKEYLLDNRAPSALEIHKRKEKEINSLDFGPFKEEAEDMEDLLDQAFEKIAEEDKLLAAYREKYDPNGLKKLQERNKTFREFRFWMRKTFIKNFNRSMNGFERKILLFIFNKRTKLEFLMEDIANEEELIQRTKEGVYTQDELDIMLLEREHRFDDFMKVFQQVMLENAEDFELAEQQEEEDIWVDGVEMGHLLHKAQTWSEVEITKEDLERVFELEDEMGLPQKETFSSMFRVGEKMNFKDYNAAQVDIVPEVQEILDEVNHDDKTVEEMEKLEEGEVAHYVDVPLTNINIKDVPPDQIYEEPSFDEDRYHQNELLKVYMNNFYPPNYNPNVTDGFRRWFGQKHNVTTHVELEKALPEIEKFAHFAKKIKVWAKELKAIRNTILFPKELFTYKFIVKKFFGGLPRDFWTNIQQNQIENYYKYALILRQRFLPAVQVLDEESLSQTIKDNTIKFDHRLEMVRDYYAKVLDHVSQISFEELRENFLQTDPNPNEEIPVEQDFLDAKEQLKQMKKGYTTWFEKFTGIRIFNDDNDGGENMLEVMRKRSEARKREKEDIKRAQEEEKKREEKNREEMRELGRIPKLEDLQSPSQTQTQQPQQPPPPPQQQKPQKPETTTSTTSTTPPPPQIQTKQTKQTTEPKPTISQQPTTEQEKPKQTTTTTTPPPPQVQTKQTTSQQEQEPKATILQQPSTEPEIDITKQDSTEEKIEQEKTEESTFEEKPQEPTTALVHVEERPRTWYEIFSEIASFARKRDPSKNQNRQGMFSRSTFTSEETEAFEKLRSKKPDFTVGYFQAEMEKYLPMAMKYIIRNDPLAKVYLTKEFANLQPEKFTGIYRRPTLEEIRLKEELEKKKEEERMKQKEDPNDPKKEVVTFRYDTVDMLGISKAEFLTSRIINGTPMIFLMFKTQELRGEPWDVADLIKEIDIVEEKGDDSDFLRKRLTMLLSRKSEVSQCVNVVAILWHSGDRMWKIHDHTQSDIESL